MRKPITLLTLLLCFVCGLTASAQTTVTHYKPGARKASLVAEDLVFIYNTCFNGTQDRTGFVYNAGSSINTIKDKPYSDASSFHYDKAAGTSVWKVVSVDEVTDDSEYANGTFIRVALQSASSNTYLSGNGNTTSSSVQYIYMRKWTDTSVPSAWKAGVKTETGNGTTKDATSIEDADCAYLIASSINFNSSSIPSGTFWNGDPSSFATWSSAHPFVFYSVVDASTEYQAKLNEAKTTLNSTITAAYNNYNGIEPAYDSPTAVTLTADVNLFSNAEQTKTGTADADAFLSKLTDGDNATYFQSSWQQDKASAPNEYHYLQVNLEQAVELINFNYRTRDYDDGPHPSIIDVQCSSDGINYVSAATLTKDADYLPQTARKNYFSRVIGLPFAAKYIRYVVKATSNANAFTNGYPNFALAEFGMNIYTFAESSATTDALDAEWWAKYGAEIAAAEAVRETDNSDLLVSDVNAANTKLTEVGNAYARYVANKSNTLYTKDPANPNVFAIKSGRSGTTNYSGNWYFVFKPLDGGKIKIEKIDETAYLNNLYTYWYLMADASTGYCRLYPYVEPTKPMGYTTVSDGANKLTNVSTTTNYVGDLYELVSTSNATFTYALKPAGKSTYVSNYGGGNNFMGFYNSIDGGTMFAVIDADVLGNIESLRALHEAYMATPTSRLADEKYGTALNTVNEEHKTTYDEAYPAAATALTTTATTATTETLSATTTKLLSLPSLLKMNQPATGKFYRFKSVKHSNKFLRSNQITLQKNATTTETRLACGANDDNGRESIFYLTPENKIVAYVEGQYVGNNKENLSSVGSAGDAYRFDCGKDNASYTIRTQSGDRALYCKETTYSYTAGEETIRNTYYHWDIGTLTNNAHSDNGYDWVIEEVAWLPVGVSTAAGFGTLYSPVALGQTNGVDTRRIQAYTGAVADGVLKLTPIEGTIPQNTPVIFEYLDGAEGEEGKQNVFLPVTGDVEGDAYANNGTNGYLSGQFVTTAKAADASIYTLQNKSTHGIGMYKYNGTNIKAFRAYLPYTAPAERGALRIVFDDVTTGIEGIEVNDGGKTAIYDLSGRRVSRMTKGFYIVNGKKTLIK